MAKDSEKEKEQYEVRVSERVSQGGRSDVIPARSLKHSVFVARERGVTYRCLAILSKCVGDVQLVSPNHLPVDVDVSANVADVCAQQGASQAAERDCRAQRPRAAQQREKDNQRALDVVAASAALLMRGRPAIDGFNCSRCVCERGTPAPLPPPQEPREHRQHPREP
jgi:hypothetical protein